MERAENAGAEKREAAECCTLISANVRRVVTVTCCFLFSCCNGTMYAFGNINPYLTSYMRNRTSEHDIDFTDTVWIIQTLSIVAAGLMPLVGLLANRLPTKLFLATGVLCQAASLFGTYWTVKRSFLLVVLTYGVFAGAPMAIIDPVTIRVAVGWVPGRKGVMIGVVLMGYGVGAVVWNELTTWFINPDNLQANLHVGGDVYFSQAAVLDNVPRCFLLLGTVCGVVQGLCLFLMCLPPPSPPSQAMYSGSGASDEEKTRLLAAQDGPEEDPVTSKISHSIQEGEFDDVASGTDHHSAMTAAGNRHIDGTFGGDRTDSRQTGRLRASQAADVTYRPMQVLRSRPFWTIWLMGTVSSVSFVFVVSLFKAYGETFISDDHFLALVASLSSVSNAAGRPFWGLAADRFGYRMVCLVAQCLLAALVGSFVTCEETGKAGFLIWVCGMFLSMCGFFTMIYALVFALFGSRHYNVNIGLMNVSNIPGVLLAGLLAPVVKASLGWHGMFYVGFAGLFVGVLLNMSLSIQWGNSIPGHMRPVLSLHS